MRNLIEQAEVPEMVVYVVRNAWETFKSIYFHSAMTFKARLSTFPEHSPFLNQCRAMKENTTCVPSVPGPHSEEYIEDAMVSVVTYLTVTQLVLKCCSWGAQALYNREATGGLHLQLSILSERP